MKAHLGIWVPFHHYAINPHLGQATKHLIILSNHVARMHKSHIQQVKCKQTSSQARIKVLVKNPL
jgi:hypothetical protein